MLVKGIGKRFTFLRNKIINCLLFRQNFILLFFSYLEETYWFCEIFIMRFISLLTTTYIVIWSCSSLEQCSGLYWMNLKVFIICFKYLNYISPAITVIYTQKIPKYTLRKICHANESASFINLWKYVYLRDDPDYKIKNYKIDWELCI